MKLARVALPGPYPVDGSIVYGLVRKFASGDIEGSLELAGKYAREVAQEKVEALSALEVLDKWFENNPGSREKILFTTRKVAADYLKLNTETLRTWERNGLFAIRRSESGRLLFSEWDIEK